MTLPEAAARCLAANRQEPRFNWAGFRSFYPGDSDEERHCRYVIDEAASLLGLEDPREAAAVRARLERELGAMLRRGPLELPEVAAVVAD
jgi:hypothetical protein